MSTASANSSGLRKYELQYRCKIYGWEGRRSAAVRSKQMRRPRPARRRGVRTCDESRRSPSSVGDREDEQEALPCPHVLFSHGSKLFLSRRVEDWGGSEHTHTHTRHKSHRHNNVKPRRTLPSVPPDNTIHGRVEQTAVFSHTSLRWQK